MFAGGVGRIFKEFDSFLESSSCKDKKKAKKQRNLTENFFKEVSCLLNIDRSQFELGNLPWGMIFYSRMLSEQRLLSQEKHQAYIEAFQNYLEYAIGNKKYEKKKLKYIKNTKRILSHLEQHRVDPDSALIGLTPSNTITARFEAWLASPCTHEEECKNFDTNPNDSLSLLALGFPGKKGDLVIARIEYDKLGPDLRNSAVISSSEKRFKKDKGVNIFARIKDAVQFNQTTFLDLYLAPKEEAHFSINITHIELLSNLIPPGQSWKGNVKEMREMVADPYEAFLEVIERSMIKIFDQALKPYDIEVAVLHEAVQHEPISFLHYHALQRADPILKAFVPSNNDTTENIEEIPYSAIRDQFLKECDILSKNHLQSFVEAINQQDGTKNQLFMPTSEQDLMRLHRFNSRTTAEEFLVSLSNSISSAVEDMKIIRSCILSGTLKNQLSTFWLMLIESEYKQVLAQTGYDASAWNSDTYIDEPPADIVGVRKNLDIIKSLIDKHSEYHHLVCAMTERVKSESYPLIDTFIMDSQIILSYELLGVKLDNDCAGFDLDMARSAFVSKTDEILRLHGQELVSQYDGLMKDLKYLRVMKELEYKSEEDKQKVGTGGKLELAYAVPLSGLVMGSFFRLENILKTVLELWERKPTKIQPLDVKTELVPCGQPLPTKNSLLERPKPKKAKTQAVLSFATLRQKPNRKVQPSFIGRSRLRSSQ